MRVENGIKFTEHAFVRVQERLSLSPEEIAKIIVDDSYVPIGTEKQRVHKVFYSMRDRGCFVLVHDESRNEVVTILPPYYHHRWRIAQQTFDKARELIERVEDEQANNDPAECSSFEYPGLAVVNFVCYFTSHEGKKVKPINFKSKIKKAELEDFLMKIKAEDRLFLLQTIEERVDFKIFTRCRLDSAFYRIGLNGELQRIC